MEEEIITPITKDELEEIFNMDFIQEALEIEPETFNIDVESILNLNE